MDRNVRLSDLALEEFREVDPSLDEGVFGILGVEKAVAALRSYGSAGPEQVHRQIERWKERVGS
jgi:argininosuccinate lyase